MHPFSISSQITGDHITYKVQGYIDERAMFPEVEKLAKITLDLDEVKGLNSVGTRSWCTWVKQMSPPSKVFLEGCPMLFVKAFNQIVGSLNANMTINSFFVPYCSADLTERKNILYQRGIHYTEAGTIKYPEVLDSKGKPMELDVLNQYFNFIKS